MIRDRLGAKADTSACRSARTWTITPRASPTKDIMIYSAYDDSVVINLPGWHQGVPVPVRAAGPRGTL